MPLRFRAALVLACVVPLAACTGGGGGSATDAGVPAADQAFPRDLAPAVQPGPDTTITAFDARPVYYTGSDNQRTVDAQVSFPKEGAYRSITLHLQVLCPSGGCDPWDRLGTLGVVTAKGTNGDPDTVVEIARFVTPYGVRGTWDVDVTDLRPLLTGDVTLRGFIDTWVGPGSQYGGGWLLDASFEMKGGVPAKLPIADVPVWTARDVVYGDPSKPIDQAAPPVTVQLPPASSYALRSFVTGHGQGNAGNCAEFCARTHTFTVGGTPHDSYVWRDDCDTTAAPGQHGSWQYPRSGWCPGADVKPIVNDITADVAGASAVQVAYSIEDYTNTCRPDATPCTGCTLGTGCAYDGGNHTEPFFSLSSLIVAYR